MAPLLALARFAMRRRGGLCRHVITSVFNGASRTLLRHQTCNLRSIKTKATALLLSCPLLFIDQEDPRSLRYELWLQSTSLQAPCSSPHYGARLRARCVDYK